MKYRPVVCNEHVPIGPLMPQYRAATVDKCGEFGDQISGTVLCETLN